MVPMKAKELTPPTRLPWEAALDQGVAVRGARVKRPVLPTGPCSAECR